MNNLFFTISFVAIALGLLPKYDSLTRNVASNDTIPVTVTSSIPKDGGVYELDTELKFTKTDPNDENNYCFTFCSSPEVMKRYYYADCNQKDPFEEIKTKIFDEIGADWTPIADFSKTYKANFFEAQALSHALATYCGRQTKGISCCLWVAKKDEDEVDTRNSYVAASSFNYTPGIIDYSVLPDYFAKVGEIPVTHYDNPDNQFSAEIAWFKNGEMMPPEETFATGYQYTPEFTITPNSEYKGLPPIESYNGIFSFGSFNQMCIYDEDSEKYKLYDDDYITPIVSEKKDTIISEIRVDDFNSQAQNYCIYGKYDNAWKQTTYFNEGFATFLYEGDDIAQNYRAAQLVAANTTTGTNLNSFNVKLDFKHLNDDMVLQVNYIITNISPDQKCFSLGSTADIQIGSDDDAICYPFSDGSGFRMVSDHLSDIDNESNHAQLNFWCKNSKNVTDVDHFWYGAYDEDYYKVHCTEAHKENFLPWRGESYWSDCEKACTFIAEEKNRLSAYDKSRWQWEEDEETGLYRPYILDSAMAWSWTNRTLNAGETRTYSVLFSIGGPGSEDVVTGDFTAIKSIDDTIFYSGSKNFNVTKIHVGSNDLDPSAYRVDVANKSITFYESANLKPGDKVLVYLDNTPIDVRNNILPKGPSVIKMQLNDDTDPVELKEGRYKVFLDDDGHPSETETNRFIAYDPITGKITLQNVPEQNKLIIPEDTTVPDGAIQIKLVGESTINRIDSAYSITLYSDNVSDTLNAKSITTNKFAVKKCSCTIDASDDARCLNNCNEINVEGGHLTLNADNAAIVADGGDDISITGPISINAKVGINNASKGVILNGEVNINSSECGITSSTLTIVNGCTLTINNATGESLSIDRVIIPEGYKIVGGSIDNEGHFTPTEGATQLIIYKDIIPSPSVPCFTHWILLALLFALIGFTLILWFACNIRNFKDREKDKLNIAPICGFSIHLVGVIITALFMHCIACHVLLTINLVALGGLIALYMLYKTKSNDEETKTLEEENDDSKAK